MNERVASVMETAIANERIVGSVVVVARDGTVVVRRAAGFSDREAKRPMREDTIFRLASLTKPVVTVVALALVEAGRLALDRPIADVLPEFRPAMPDGSTPPLTIAHLLTHTAGLSYAFMERADGPYRRARVSDGLGEPGVSTADEIARIVNAGLQYEPGTRWQYSLAIDVLGFALERITNESLPDLVRHTITAPLDMPDTTFFTTPSERIATPYADGSPAPIRMSDPQIAKRIGTDSAGATFSPSRAFSPDSFPSGGAGLVGTASDMLRFFEAIRTGGAGIITPQTIATMMQNHTGDFPIALGPGWGFGYGAAVLIDRIAAQTPQSNGTWQWGGAYGHSWFVDPAQRLTVVALTNTAYEGMNGRYPADLRDAIYASL
jgi:CubicO group peptidase (beta-lactamase class C family)